MMDIVAGTGKELVERAVELGFKGLVMPKEIKADLKIYTAKDIVMHRHDDNDRKLVEKGKVDLIYGLELESRKDYMHSKASGLDHVLCKLLHLKKVIVGFNFNDLLKAKGEKRALLLGRMSQNIRWCRKYKIKTAIFSFASKASELRNPGDLQALFKLLGMHAKEASDSFLSVEKKILEKRKTVAKGIKRL